MNIRNRCAVGLMAGVLLTGGFCAGTMPATLTARAESIFSPNIVNFVSRNVYHPTTTNENEDAILQGGEIRFLQNTKTKNQQLSAVIRSQDGKILVVDGGQAADAEHLIATIQEMGGGVVDAWIITHPQTDHVGGLYEVLKNHSGELDIRNIYYNFTDYDWYKTADPDECGMVWVLMEQLNQLDPSIVHGHMERDQEVRLSDSLSFRVMNSPVLTSGPYAVNSSGLMYDVTIDGKHLIILGDMGEEVGNQLMEAGVLDGVTADLVQMSHHGQDGVGQAFYQKLNPQACIWPTTSWIFDPGTNPNGLLTETTKKWIADLGIARNYVTINGDVILH